MGQIKEKTDENNISFVLPLLFTGRMFREVFSCIYCTKIPGIAAPKCGFGRILCASELTEEEIAVFCERLYQHALELYPEEEKIKLKKIGKNQLISYRLVIEEKDKYYATNGYQMPDGKLEDYPDASKNDGGIAEERNDYSSWKQALREVADKIMWFVGQIGFI